MIRACLEYRAGFATCQYLFVFYDAPCTVKLHSKDKQALDREGAIDKASLP